MAQEANNSKSGEAYWAEIQNLAEQAKKIEGLKDLLQEGKNLEAIKLYREHTGTTLAQALRVIVALHSEMKLPKMDLLS